MYHETSLSGLSEHEWQIVSNLLNRPVDWYVHKVGRKWAVDDRIAKRFPLFKTKHAAFEAASNLVCAEARHRLWVRETGGDPEKG